MRSRSRLVLSAVASLAALTVVPLGVGASHAAASAAETVTTLTAPATADTFTQYASPTTNSGSSLRWSLDGRAAVKRRVYLKFRLPALTAGSTMSKVVLRAYVESNGASSGPGPVIYRTSNAWTESGLVWNNQPLLGQQAATTTAPYGVGTWVSWDVTSGLSAAEKAGGADVSFALTTAELRWLGFRSRESLTAPNLTITATGEAAPTEAAVELGWGSPVAGDEFTYTGAPDPTKWSVWNSAGHDGNGLRASSAWNVDGSVATVVGDEHGTTGAMAARFDRRQYGRWEVRMRTNVRDPEYHPVLLLWPDTAASTCPEVDFAEGSTDTTAMSFYQHYGCGSVQTWGRRIIDTTQWHNYAVSWTPTGIVGYIDGVEWFRDTNLSHLPPGPMHLSAQLDWFPDGTATTRSSMQLDWVRVYNAS